MPNSYQSWSRRRQTKRRTLSKYSTQISTSIVQIPFLPLRFPETEKISPPLLQMSDVTFGYTTKKIILKDVNIDVGLDSRIAIVGANGAGKSTLSVTSCTLLNLRLTCSNSGSKYSPGNSIHKLALSTETDGCVCKFIRLSKYDKCIS